MDTAFGFLIGSVVFAGWVFAFLYAFRHRVQLCKWLNASDMPSTLPPDRKTILQRRIVQGQWKIDDAKAELESLELAEKK